MKANPGGHIAPELAIGREGLLCSIWETIENQSVIMTAERRIGKTTIMKMMKQSPVEGWTALYSDLEKIASPEEFAMSVYRDVHRFLNLKDRSTRRVKELFETFGGAEIGGFFTLPQGKKGVWKDVLEKSIEDLAFETEAKDGRLLFLWDELPYMIENIRNREGGDCAMEILDLLRSLRITHPCLRMVFTGSIGLHHVIQSLHDQDYANAPVNDMFPIEVPPLEKDDAVQLALKIISGEEISCENPTETAEEIAILSGGFPFYIHHIIKALKMSGSTANPKNAQEVVRTHLTHADDPWELRHFQTRIKRYYGAENEPFVIGILDHIASLEVPQSIPELLAHLKSILPFDDKEQLIKLLRLMQQDHYLIKNTEGRFAFKFNLIQRWWKLERAL